MRSYPDDKYGRDELKRLDCEQWMVEHLKLNPEYPHWGPGEDYMCKTDGNGWSASQEVVSWSEFGPWGLDDLNECVHFYFELERPSENCAACDRSGYNPETKIISDTFYDHGDYSIDFVNWKVRGSIENARKAGGATGRRWQNAITQDELDALVKAGRIKAGVSLLDVNIANGDDRDASRAACQRSGLFGGHDAINRGILIETRAKRLGVYGLCEKCDGHGYVYTSPAGQLNFVVWMIHPRKGASRGVRVRNLSQEDASAARQWLRQAAERNAARFAKVVQS